ncbi:MAG: N-acetylmuramoyl-L-alanine amidase [bacterium]
MKYIKFILMFLMLKNAISSNLLLEEIRYWSSPEYTRVVFDLNHSDVQYEIIESSNPSQINIYLKNIKSEIKKGKMGVNDKVIKSIEILPEQNGIRVILELLAKTQFKSLFLQKSGEKTNRLIIDCQYAGYKEEFSEKEFAEIKKKKQIIVIDAGHGGEDPGAISRYKKIQEKDVVLKVAQKLKKLINSNNNLKAILTRESDYFIPLKERTKMACKYQADLFISIHANSTLRNFTAKGTHVYILSPKGASDEFSRITANIENASDMMSEIEIEKKEEKNELLIKTLVDLSQTNVLNKSYNFANALKNEFLENRDDKEVEIKSANFMVLRSINTPSILLEIAFLSNLSEEELLIDENFQEKVAQSTYNGILNYLELEGKIPVEKIYCSNTVYHIVQKGDTLLDLAHLYNLSANVIKKINGLRSKYLYPGQKLLIANP